MTRTENQLQGSNCFLMGGDIHDPLIVSNVKDETPVPGPPLMSERPNAERDGEIGRLRSEGWTYRALAERFGLSAPGVQCVLRREEYRRDRPPVLGLSTRATNALRMDRVIEGTEPTPLMLAAIAARPYKELRKIPNLGDGTILEMARMLRRHGLAMRGLPPRLLKALDGL
jgi:hypothetical protein